MEAKESDAQDFFNSLGNQQEETPADFVPESDEFVTKTTRVNKDWSQGTESLIKQNILISNHQGAIDLCLKVDRVAEAFLIAKSHPTDSQKLSEQILSKLAQLSEEEFVKGFMWSFSQRNFKEVINSYDVKEWKEILYFIQTHIKSSESQKQMHQILIQKLQDKNETKLLTKVLLFLNQHQEYKENLV